MSTRTIVTSQPDVACDVCERRLLRGEQPDVFIAAGRRLTVCELCAPRAAHEGWMRETDMAAVGMPPPRPRRGRNLLDRLRGRPADAVGPDELDEGGEQHPRSRRPVTAVPAVSRMGEEEAFGRGLDDEAPLISEEDAFLDRAVAVFNASEFPRRVAGVARSLGAPEVSVRNAEHLASVVILVVAWELCWYRYEVDVTDGMAVVTVLDQGAELSQLPHDDRLGNALASDTGVVSLLPRP